MKNQKIITAFFLIASNLLIQAQTINNQSMYWQPTHTNRIQLGEFEPYQLKEREASLAQMQLQKPICLVGDDDISFAWLEKRLNQLKKIGAMCFIVNIDTQARFDEIKEMVGDLEIGPYSADFFIDHYGLKFYPVLLTQEWVTQ